MYVQRRNKNGYERAVSSGVKLGEMCRGDQDCLFLKTQPSYMLWQTWMALSSARVLVGSMAGIEYPLSHSFRSTVWTEQLHGLRIAKKSTPLYKECALNLVWAKTSPLFLYILLVVVSALRLSARIGIYLLSSAHSQACLSAQHLPFSLPLHDTDKTSVFFQHVLVSQHLSLFLTQK